MLFTVTNTGVEDNGRPTSIGLKIINLASEATHFFTIANFTSETSPIYIDPEDDPMAYIRILSLPVTGILYLSGSPVQVGDSILSADLSLSSFTYVAEPGNSSAYIDTFTFDAADTGSNSLSGLTDGIVQINVADAINLPPDVVGNKTLNAIYGASVIFTGSNFTSGTSPAYNDPEGDAPYKVKILDLPADGTLKFNGVDVIANQEMTVAQIDAGYLIYIPDLGITTPQSLTFNFSVSDVGSEQFTT